MSVLHIEKPFYSLWVYCIWNRWFILCECTAYKTGISFFVSVQHTKHAFHSLQALSFPQSCSWGFRSFGKWQYVTNFHDALTALHFIQMLRNTNLVTQYLQQIPDPLFLPGHCPPPPKKKLHQILGFHGTNCTSSHTKKILYLYNVHRDSCTSFLIRQMTEKETGDWECGKYEQVGEWGKKCAENKWKMRTIFCYKDTHIVKNTVLLNAYFLTKCFTQFWLIYSMNQWNPALKSEIRLVKQWDLIQILRCWQ